MKTQLAFQVIVSKLHGKQ